MFTRPRLREVVQRYLKTVSCCSGGECGTAAEPQLVSLGSSSPKTSLPVANLNGASDEVLAAFGDFVSKALDEKISTSDVFRITITSFLDAYNFDIRRLMKCCVHHVLPSGHVIPFCAYNVLYREGHVPLPTLDALSIEQPG